uniref:Uncharacterized protein n=1 Tax=Anguilla anguilla TaxID=7936 RepID=A0A0E9SB35_ANGAN
MHPLFHCNLYDIHCVALKQQNITTHNYINLSLSVY